ncbi:helix-turn-helix domain-containing protein [Achromobacter spanius]|uniref:helix-turn-helix domain-containing protein n=1 Tax=Achromobacter spanius TaxID=217203 RepID=UPI0038212447
MASWVGVSPSRLHAMFCTELGTSPQAWLADTRLQHARHCLASTSMPISEIAGRTGYSEQSALTRAFRRSTGVTPAQYRQVQQALRSKT